MTFNVADYTDASVLPAPHTPMAVAHAFVDDRYRDAGGTLTLRHWRGAWWRWRTSRWAEVEHRAVRADVYAFTEHAGYLDKKGEVHAWAPNRSRVADLLEALAAICHLPDSIAQPAWLDGRDSGVIVSCANGLLDVRRRELLDHTPAFFNQVAVPFGYDADALAPKRWEAFLEASGPTTRRLHARSPS